MQTRAEIPTGIHFGTKICWVRKIPDIVFHIFFSKIEWRQEAYTWVNRGEPIMRIKVKEPFSAKHSLTHLFATEKILLVRSPASGLLLENSPERGLIFILMPDDEPNPNYMKWVFGDLISHLHTYREMYRYSEEDIKDTVAIWYGEDRHPCHVENALPQYRDYLDEARIKDHNLRPLLQHLV